MATTKATILLVEDDMNLAFVTKDNLENKGYAVQHCIDGVSCFELFKKEQFDLCLLDVMLPKVDGFAVAAELRRIGSAVPILLLTAKGGVEDRVTGLDAGADDYLAKPFSPQELLARVRALLRRVERAEVAVDRVQLGSVEIDFVRQTARRGSGTVRLTPKEFAMLRMLVEARGEVVTREQFLDVIWGYNAFPTTRTVDTHMAALRSKVEEDPAQPRHLLTVHGAGYRWAA